MKKIVRNGNLFLTMLLLCAIQLVNSDSNNGNNGVFALIAKLQPHLTQEQKNQVRDEVMREEIIRFLDLGELSEGSSTYEIVTGFIDEAVKKVVPAKEVGVQSEQIIFDSIKTEKGQDALPSVKAVLKHLNAQPLEYIKNSKPLDEYDPAVIRITVPNQVGQTCGIWALANLLAVQRLMGVRYLPERAVFTRISENLFERHFKSCPKELAGVNLVAEYAKKTGLSHVVLVGVDETQGNKIYTYPIVGQKNFAELLQDFVADKIPVLNIIVHSKTSKAGRHAEHWTAASVINRNDVIADPVIVFMNSLGNDPFAPTYESTQKVLRYISRQVTDAYDVLAEADEKFEEVEDIE